MNKMTAEDPGKTFWRDAAADGGILGVMLLVVMLLDEFTNHQLTAVAFLLKAIILAASIYILAYRRSLKYHDAGFSIGQGMKFIVAMTGFAGFITGIGNYLAVNFISPDYYQIALDQAYLSLKDSLEGLIENAGMSAAEYWRRVDNAMHSPITYLVSGVLGKVVVGAVIGAFVAPMVKRTPVSGNSNE